MGAYVETCGTTAAGDSFVATGGIEKIPNTGYLNALLWVSDTFSGTILELKDKETYDTAVATNDVIFLGNGKFEDTSVEATFFEDTDLSIRVEQTPKIKSLLFTLATCACTSAQLEKMENKTGRLLMQTSTSAVWGRYDNGIGKGMAISSISVDSTLPVSATPVEYTTLAITFSDYKGDRKNPLRIAAPFLFSEIDQVFAADGISGTTSSDGTTLTSEITINKDCTSEKLTGLVLANFKAVDVDGNVLTIASVTEAGTTGVYTVNITTALTKAFVSTDGIITNASILYYMDAVTVTV